MKNPMLKLMLIDLRGADRDGIARTLETFPASRQTEILRFRWEAARTQTVVAEAAVRAEIMYGLNLSRRDVRILRCEGEKPKLLGDALCFNVSHAGDFVACGFSERPLGVDLESLRSFPIAPIVNRCFSEREKNEISANPLRAFFRLWTAKESVIKFRGTGFSELRALEIVDSSAYLHGELLPCRIASYEFETHEKVLYESGRRNGGELYALSVCCGTAPEITETVFCSANEILERYLAHE